MVAALAAAPAAALDPGAARHLLARAGFGATPAEVAALAPLDQAAAVRRLLDGVRSRPVTPEPAFLAAPRPDWRAFHANRDPLLYQEFRRLRLIEVADLRAWWIGEMLATPSPLTERMVLFWHGRFTTSADKVFAADLLWRQNQLFRTHAAGDYRALLRGIVRDAAMLRWLDGVQNTRAGPNENFAREFLELFTLGEGGYDERDVRETARAFSGWQIDEASGAPRLDPRAHDDGIKTILGRTGPWGAEDVVEIVLAQPRAAEFLVAGLWREFVSPEPDPGEVRRIAALFRAGDFRVRIVLQALFTSPAFLRESSRGTLVKAPVDLMVGTARSFGLGAGQTRALGEALRRMGQNLLAPPGVRGWPGGTAWITTQTLVERRNALATLLAGGFERPDPAAAPGPRTLDLWVARNRRLVADQAALPRLLLATAPTEPPHPGADARARIDALLFDPAYQVR